MLICSSMLYYTNIDHTNGMALQMYNCQSNHDKLPHFCKLLR